MSSFDAENEKEIIDQETLGRVSLAFREQLAPAGVDLKGPLDVDTYSDQFDNQPVSTPYNNVPPAMKSYRIAYE